MLKKTVLFSALLSAVSFQAYSFDFDGRAAAFDLGAAIASAEAPKAVPPSPAQPAGCRPLLMSVAVGGVNESLVFERACSSQNEAVWALTVESRKAPGLKARVVSTDEPATRPLVEKRIKKMFAEGASGEDAGVIVGKVGPLLKTAAEAKTAGERNELLASAVKALYDHLSRPE